MAEKNLIVISKNFRSSLEYPLFVGNPVSDYLCGNPVVASYYHFLQMKD